MAGHVGNLSRRTVIASAGGLAAASALRAHASAAADALSGDTTTRIRRISVVSSDVTATAAAIQGFLELPGDRAPSPIEHAGVESECFWAGDTLIEVSLSAAQGGHLVGLDMPAPDILLARAHAAGMRLVRDMTIRGRRLVQPDAGIPHLRLEASAPITAPARRASGLTVTGVRIATDHPAMNVRQVAALFGGSANGAAATFDFRRMAFAAPHAGDARRGLVEVTLASPSRIPASARIAGIDWRILG